MLQPQIEPIYRSTTFCDSELVSDRATASPLVNQQRRMRKLTDFYRSELENQHCADCNAHLQDSVWVSSSLGVFLCIQCAGLHRKLGVYTSRIKSLHLDTWSEKEIQQVISFGGNKKVNADYELLAKSRGNESSDFDPCHLTDDWRQLNLIRMKYRLALHADQEEFENNESLGTRLWVDEKYESDELQKEKPKENTTENKTRFINHFIVVGGKQRHLEDGAQIISLDSLDFVPVVVDMVPRESMAEDEFLLSHIPEFSFPEGYRLLNTYKAPTTFSFVLTNVNGVKLYASVFKFYEKLHPLELISLFTKTSDGQLSVCADVLNKGGTLPYTRTIYRPKCILILSHYPYFTTFQEFLRQIYRVTLSESPMPLERYITNFVSEIPVPPKGLVQVQITFPEDIHTIFRPPKNTFSLVDYSFRPLFRTLDINNILTIFTCIILEYKVVLCSKHIAILTPIAETLLSLLFPFSWQGVYIPVLPLSMWDMIEAPVPFLIGAHASMLKVMSSRMRGIFFVDLDHNRVIPALDEDDISITLPKLPDREAKKLRSKLLEYGNIFDPFASDVNKADFAFANEDNINPIDAFVVEDGHTLPHNRLHAQSNSHRISNNVSQQVGKSIRSRGVTSPSPVYLSSHSSSPASKSQLPSPSSLDSKTEQLRHRSFQRGSRASTSSSYHGESPNVGVMPSTSPNALNKHEDIWSTVSLTDSYYNETQTFSTHGIRRSFLRFFVSMLRKYPQYLRNDDEAFYTKTSFDADGFLHEITDNGTKSFLTQLLSTQMFQRFYAERADNAKSGKVLFFDQSIHEKLNRSLTIGKKKYDCSFLTDNSEEIQETFVAPPPSAFGLPEGITYKYNYFPKLKKNLFGIVRKPRNLCIIREDLHFHQSAFFRPNAASYSGWEEIRKSVIQIQSFYRMRRQRKRYLSQILAFKTFQRYVITWTKGRRHRMHFILIRTAVIKIQAIFRMRIQRRMWIMKRHMIRKLQSFMRQFLLKSRLHKICFSVGRLQAIWRGRMTRKRLQQWRSSCVQLQSIYRGCISRRHSQKEMVQAFQQTRARIFDLWKSRDVSIYYRAKFWLLFDTPNFFNLNILVEEEKRMLENERSPAQRKSEGGDQSSFLRAAFISKRSISKSPSFVPEHDNFDCGPDKVSNDQERQLLCQNLKRSCSPEYLHSFYEDFGISLGSKRRKRRLTSLIWKTYGKAMMSAEIVAMGASDLVHYRAVCANVEHIKETRCREDLAAVAIAIFKSSSAIRK